MSDIGSELQLAHYSAPKTALGGIVLYDPAREPGRCQNARLSWIDRFRGTPFAEVGSLATAWIGVLNSQRCPPGTGV